LGNLALLGSEGFWPAAFSSSGSGCRKVCQSSFPNQVSLKLRQCTKDMKDQLAATGVGIASTMYVPLANFLQKLELLDAWQDFPTEQFNFLHNLPVVDAWLLEGQVHDPRATLVMERLQLLHDGVRTANEAH
jgi:hypothetical protein